MKIKLAAAFAVICGLGGYFINSNRADANQPLKCDNSSLNGTFSFSAAGYAANPPPPIPHYPVTLGDSFALQAIGHAQFDGQGHSKGYTEEQIGGVTEADTPFEGTYTITPAVDNRGCVGTWTLQDHHTTPPFNTEPPHIFKITLIRDKHGDAYAFHFLTFGGGPGPAALTGKADKDAQPY